ncbi:ATP-binding protein [Candidatus Dependentiae bacterium]|nr:ATP-binding protein [Candidatus Dependentiae bacterium]
MKEFLKFQMEFHSNLKYIELLDEFLQMTLKRYNIPEIDIVEIVIATVEGVSNAIIHGNKSNPELKVKVVIKFIKKGISIFIQDSGKGFNPNKLENPREAKNLLKTNGRGVFIIKSYMDKIDYSFNRGTTLRMHKKINLS